MIRCGEVCLNGVETVNQSLFEWSFEEEFSFGLKVLVELFPANLLSEIL
jgi:hypothetical protein